ncbi:Sec-independent protein translocase protein TatB [Sphingobium sp.]|uniref:Sec-independent protein translocase protein TatB n=1 Tax=Sphingobium sp. TaxID=1912891 RepID=UPI003BB58958
MFGIDSTEFLLIVIVAVIVIGPKDLPRALYKVGQIVGKAQGMARHFRTGLDAMVREVELEELEKKWADQNKRIMAEHPPETSAPVMEALPAPQDDDATAVAESPAYVAQYGQEEPTPIAPQPARVIASDGPPYLAGEPGHATKDGTAA